MIFDGTYHLQSITRYTSGTSTVTPVQGKAAFVFSGGRMQTVSESGNSGSCNEERSTLNYTTSGTDFSFTTVCPANCTGNDCSATYPYTATSMDFTLYFPMGGDVVVERFKKQ